MTKLEVKEVSQVEDFASMFINAKISAQAKVMYGAYDNKSSDDTYATAVGGLIKYELASFYGLNAAVAFYGAQDISFITGSGVNHNNELSSSSGSYTQMAEAYINYKYENFNFRVGRQPLSTPLADSDDVRIIQNTFEAYIATYTLSGFEFMAGSIQNWQGFDAGLDDPWQKTGDNGTYFSGVTYKDGLEFNLWYYNITGKTNAFYFDGGFEYPINKEIILHTMVQYLDESALNNSGIQATIYGALFELVIHGLGINIAYDKALVNNNKVSFSGTGGGTLFTGMDTMSLDVIAINTDAEALVGGIVYDINRLGFLYAYGDFSSKNEHLSEHNLGMTYDVSDDLLLAGIYTQQEDIKHKNKTNFDFDRFELLLNYDF